MTTTAHLRRSGGSLIMVIPPTFAEQNHLGAGDAVTVSVDGDRLTVQPLRGRRHDVAALLEQTPAEFLQAVEWDAMPPVGQEI